MTTASLTIAEDYPHREDEDVRASLLQQYENVVVESLITSFGLDFLVQDRTGGDVDTIHNVRQIGKEPGLTYKDQTNARAYANRGEYDSTAYHHHEAYIAKNRDVSRTRKNGTLTDAYTGEKLGRKDHVDLDHILSAKEIHDDPGRVLAGLNGPDLANRDVNLKPTNSHTNRTKKADSMDKFLKRRGNEYTAAQKRRMLALDKKARAAYNHKLALNYYTSDRFLDATGAAALDVGSRMRARQVLGFIFAEIWFAVRDQLGGLEQGGRAATMKERLEAVARGFKDGLAAAKAKYRQLISRFLDGAAAGALSSLCTTLMNIFFTTAKNVVRILRQVWSSLVQAFKVLFLNPDQLPFSEKLNAAAKIIATGASIVAGTLVGEALARTPLKTIPVLGDIVISFVSAMVSGILSCTLIYELDTGDLCRQLAAFVQGMLHPLEAYDARIAYYHEALEKLEAYSAQLLQLDLERFKKETALVSRIARGIGSAGSLQELNRLLEADLEALQVKVEYGSHEDLDAFMKDGKGTLRFS